MRRRRFFVWAIWFCFICVFYKIHYDRNHLEGVDFIGADYSSVQTVNIFRAAMAFCLSELCESPSSNILPDSGDNDIAVIEKETGYGKMILVYLESGGAKKLIWCVEKDKIHDWDSFWELASQAAHVVFFYLSRTAV